MIKDAKKFKKLITVFVEEILLKEKEKLSKYYYMVLQ